MVNLKLHKITDCPAAGEAPLVSVCMITYNHRGFIAQAIDSVLMQQVDFPVEIIIHDDCSTDGTTVIVEDYAKRFPHLIRPILQTENQYSQGKKPYLTTFARARGKYLALLDGDDAWQDPQKLQMQVECLEMNQEHILCYGNVTCIDEKGEILQKCKIDPANCRDLGQEEIIGCRRVIPMATVMLRNHDILRKMPKTYFKVLNGDTFLFAILAQFGSAAYIDFVPSLYRQHTGGIYSAKTNCQRTKARLNTYRYLFRSLANNVRQPLAETMIQSYQSYLYRLWEEKHFGEFILNYFRLLNFATCKQKTSRTLQDATILLRLLKNSIKNKLKEKRRKW